MTWKEFKEIVDAEIVKQGCGDEVTINWFDFSYPTDSEDLNIDCGKDFNGDYDLTISN